MKCFVNVGTVCAALGLCLACSSAEEGAQMDPGTSPDSAELGDEPSQEAVSSQIDVLHEFDAAGVHFRFLDSDGDLLISFTRPRFTPLPEVVGPQGEELTLLEIYQALQPDGMPDARLLEDHLAQTSYLGRPDASVHRAFIEPASVEKNLQDDCIGVAAGFTGGTFVAPFYSKSALITTQNGSCTSARTTAGERGYMMHEACNTAPSALSQTIEFAKKTGTGAFVVQYQHLVPPNSADGIIQNTGNRTTRFDLRAKVVSFIPSFAARVVCGTFGEAR